jgi:hypothetical protein
MGSGSAREEALRLSREGRVAEAAALLRGATGDAERSLLFQLSNDAAERIDVATQALADARTPYARSNWALRRGLLHLDRAERDAALADLQLVLKLQANEGHVEQARVALLRVAQL